MTSFKVFYRKFDKRGNAKTYFDWLQGKDADDARKRMEAAAGELRWKVEVTKVVDMTPTASDVTREMQTWSDDTLRVMIESPLIGQQARAELARRAA